MLTARFAILSAMILLTAEGDVVVQNSRVNPGNNQPWNSYFPSKTRRNHPEITINDTGKKDNLYSLSDYKFLQMTLGWFK